MKKITFSIFSTFLYLLVFSFSTVGQNLQISGGNNFSSVVCNQQQVNVTGYNPDGQLGTDAAGNPIATGIASFRSSWEPVTMGNLTAVPTATGPSIMPAIKQADAGSGGHLLGLDCAKNVWAWGLNDAGQLGRNVSGAAVANAVPMRVLKGAQVVAGNFLDNITYVSGGNNSSFAIEETTGYVLSWGSNDYGQLGDGTVITKLTPVYVLTGPGVRLANIVQIEAGDDCSYALDASGQMWSWGITNDGANPARNLGRAIGAEVPGFAGGGTRCLPYAGRVERGTNNNNAATTNGFLDDIVSISGGDAHALGLDANGQVWSMGGDWAVGQIGQGNGGQYNYKAGRVVDIGVTTPTGPFLGDGTNNNYKAISIAAGQSSCAIVLQDATDPTNITKNRVVVFGSNCFYGFNTMVTQPSGIISFVGNKRFTAGASGRGSSGGVTALNQGVQDENTDATSYEYPMFVETSAGVPLSNVTTVSDGDAWYFATNDIGGNAVSWGWNRRGEQATGTYNDRGYATSLTLPTSCAFDYPCPGQPKLPANFSSCPIFSQILNSQVLQEYATYKYNWQFRATPGTGAWSDVSTGVTSGANKTTIVTGTNDITYAVAQLGEWRVLVSDTRASVAFLCAPCPVLKDSISIIPIPNPYTTAGCAGPSTSDYEIATPTTSQIKWYTTYTGGSPLNPSDVLKTITYANASAPTIAACGPGKALFAEDISSSQGFVFPTGQLTPTQAQISAGTGCASYSTNAGNDTYLAIEVFKNVKLTSVSTFLKNTTGNPVTLSAGSVEIYTNSPASLWNGSYNVDRYSATQVAGSPVAFSAPTMANNTTLVASIPLSINLTPGIYWIRVKGDYNIQPYYSCNPAVAGAYPGKWTTPVFDNAPGNNSIAAVAAISPANSNGYSSHGAAFDLKFETGTGYSCGRILVCQSSTACILPIELINFDATKSAGQVIVNWNTASEESSDYFNIQRSSDGINWYTIGKVTASGNTNSIVEYSFLDKTPLSTISYYRLESVDLNGRIQYSDMEKIESSSNSEISVIPNPNNGNFNITISSSETSVSLSLSNYIGQVVHQSTEEIKGIFKKDFNFAGLAKGVYFLTVKTVDGQDIVKIVIE